LGENRGYVCRVAALVDVLKTGAKDSDDITAAMVLLDRGYGKPATESLATPETQRWMERVVFEREAVPESWKRMPNASA